MTVKTNGSEFSKFYKDPEFWPEGRCHEEEVITVNGNTVDENTWDPDQVNPKDAITVSGGNVWDEVHTGKDFGSFESYFRKWQKKQNKRTLLVTMDSEKEATIRSILQSKGCTVQ